MSLYALVHKETGRILARRASLARNLRSSLLGWIENRQPVSDEAIGIPGNWVHTWFVAFALDLVYCDNSGRVLRVVAALPPYRIGPFVLGASVVWEMPEGTLASLVVPGCVLELQEVAEDAQ